MTTPTRPLPQGVEIRKFPEGWYPCKDFDHGRCRVFLRSCGGEWSVELKINWTGDCGFPTEGEAIAAFWAWHDRQPENQAKAEPKYDSPGYRAGYAAGLESAERVIASLAAHAAGVASATPPAGHIIDDQGVVRKVRMQAVFVGGTLPCAIPLKPGETVMAVEPAAEAARKEGGT